MPNKNNQSDRKFIQVLKAEAEARAGRNSDIELPNESGTTDIHRYVDGDRVTVRRGREIVKRKTGESNKAFGLRYDAQTRADLIKERK